MHGSCPLQDETYCINSSRTHVHDVHNHVSPQHNTTSPSNVRWLTLIWYALLSLHAAVHVSVLSTSADQVCGGCQGGTWAYYIYSHHHLQETMNVNSHHVQTEMSDQVRSRSPHCAGCLKALNSFPNCLHAIMTLCRMKLYIYIYIQYMISMCSEAYKRDEMDWTKHQLSNIASKIQQT